MKLTTDQINQIDQTLVLNKVVYDDIKLELTDHIASDIEEIMDDENVSFEMAFKEAFEKWEVQLKPKTGFWNPERNRFTFSKMDVQPKLIMDKMERIAKKKLLNSILISVVIGSLILGIAKIYGGETVLRIVNESYKILCLIVIGLLFFGRVFMFKFKGATTFGHLFKVDFYRTIWMPIFNLFMLSTIFAFSSAPMQYAVMFILINFGLVRGVLSLRLLYKHFQFEKKLSKA